RFTTRSTRGAIALPTPTTCLPRPARAARARRGLDRRSLRLGLVVSPEPAERVGKDCPAVAVVVEPLAVDELEVVVLECQRLGHLLIRQGPVAVNVVEVVGAILE